MIPTRDFSGLTSWACALANAAAIAPMVSLERCTAWLPLDEVKADCTCLGALGPDPVPDDLFGILRHQSLELGFGSLMLEKGLTGLAKQSSKFAPGIRGAHIDNPDCLDAGFWWIDTEEPRGLSALDT